MAKKKKTTRKKSTKRKAVSRARASSKWKPAPLPSSFLLIAILGFIISGYSIYPRNESWGLAFLILFTLMFVASLISMVEGDPEVEWQMEKRHL